MAALLAGLPETVPGVTVNRLCASGLEAVGQAARAIGAGEAELVLAGGVESMSRSPYVLAKAGVAFARDQKLEDTTLGWRLVNPAMEKAYGIDSMTQTAENLAREDGVARGPGRLCAAQPERAERARAEAARRGDRPRHAAGREAKRVEADEQPRPATTAGPRAAQAARRARRHDHRRQRLGPERRRGVRAALASEQAAARHGLEPIARVGRRAPPWRRA
jgi:acetyl-CoA acetyltransferase